jgi:DNA-binding protein HU-beta
MTKRDLIAHVSETTGVTKAHAAKMVGAMLQGIEEALVNREACKLLGFGIFNIRKKGARIGRNPKTGETIKIKESFTVSFSAGKNLKRALNLS